MKIAIIGYGKMGRMIERLAIERGHEITCRIDIDNQSDFLGDAFRRSDVAIEFTTPATAPANIDRCFEAGVPVVCGSTGWVNEKARLADGTETNMLRLMQHRCEAGEGTLLWASNFSIGVNIFMAINRYLAQIMNSFPQYAPSMTEIHHVHKLDHPSGTAITLAEQIVENTDRFSGWAEHPGPGIIEISHERQGEVPGIHTIRWDSDVDDISITHSAKSREGFALGAVMAAEWLADKKGFRTIGEMMADITKQDIFK